MRVREEEGGREREREELWLWLWLRIEPFSSCHWYSNEAPLCRTMEQTAGGARLGTSIKLLWEFFTM